MSDFEQIDLDEEVLQVRFARSDFAQVIFHNIAETYPTDANVECSYTITPSLTSSARDWVGLYKVGWSSHKDYVYFEWAPVPEGYEPGKAAESTIVFQTTSLPKDDGEFYQFCYVTSASQVRGASTPFQFKQPSADEYIAIEDDENDIMVIKTRTAALEEDLRRAAFENEELQKSKQYLERERDGLLAKLVELEKLAQQQKDEKTKLQGQAETLKDQVTTLNSEASDMQMVHDGLRDKLNNINQEKEEVLKRLEENEVYLKSLQEKIKMLINEKDALVGKNKMLEDEKDLFKHHFTSSEGTLQGYVQQIELLRRENAAQEEERTMREEEAQALREELEKRKHKLKRQASICQADKIHMEDLVEGLRNAEDMLAAAEHCKQMLNDEVNALQQAHQKISHDLENSKSESHSLKIQLAKLDERHKREEKELKEEIRTLHRGIEDKAEEHQELCAKLVAVQRKTQEMEVQKSGVDGPMLVLQKAQADLRKRYSKMKEERDSMKKEMEELLHRKEQWDEERQDLKSELKDLKSRLKMGREEFQNKYIECRKLQMELRRLDRQVKQNSPGVEKKTCEMQTSTIESTKEEATPKVEKVEAQTSTSMIPEDIADLTNTELQAQLDDLGRELEQRSSKKQRYKIKYQEEREKNAFLQRYYFEELKKKEEELTRKDEEMERLKLQMQDDHEQMMRKRNMRDALVETALQQQKQQIRKLMMEKQQMEESQKPPSPPIRHQPLRRLVSQPPSSHRCGARFPPPPTCDLTANVTIMTPVLPPPLQPMSTRDDLTLNEDDLESDGGVSREDLEKLAEELEIPLNAGNPPIPLRPLPPPMQPEITPEARLAAVRAQCELIPRGPVSSEFYPSLEEVKVDSSESELQEVKVEPSAPPTEPKVNIPEWTDHADLEEEKFEDAISEPAALLPQSRPPPPPKQCPVCKLEFPADVSDVFVLDHIDSHYGPICPVCNDEFAVGYKQSAFQEHVDSHFDD